MGVRPVAAGQSRSIARAGAGRRPAGTAPRSSRRTRRPSAGLRTPRPHLRRCRPTCQARGSSPRSEPAGTVELRAGRPPRRGPPARALGRGQDPAVLADDVLGPRTQRSSQRPAGVLELSRVTSRGVGAIEALSESPCRLPALGAPLGIGRVAEPAGNPRFHDGQGGGRGEPDGPDRERPAVDQQPVAGRPAIEASWSIAPQGTPTYSSSARRHRLASSAEDGWSPG